MTQKEPAIKSYDDNIRNSSPHALLRGLGLSKSDLKKPRIAIINTWNSINPGHVHLNELAEAVKEGILEAGGLPFNFNITNLCDGIGGGPYILASRDLMCNEIEVIMDGCQLDAMVLLATCDKNVPGVLMGAARMDVPAIIVTGGYMQTITDNGKIVDGITIGNSCGEVDEGVIDMEEMMHRCDIACPAPGACGFMGTANTMCTLTEALGMSLPGNATLPAISSHLRITAREAGRKIMDLWRKGITARQIITEESVTNAVKVCMAIGGSTNTMMHMPAVAAEAGLDIDVWDIYDKASHEIPLLMNVRPTGVYTMADFDHAGGLRSVMYEIKDHLNLNCKGVNEKTVAENIEGHKTPYPDVIRSMDNPFTKDGGICILKGNIAPDGCAAKQSTFPRNMLKFRGPAKVFYSNEDACEALRAGKIQAGDAVVISMMGAKAGPGMLSAYGFTSELAGTSLWDKVCLITDGRFSGAAKGAITGYCSPEAGLGGPICAVRDGDIISYDIETRSINVELTDEQIAERIKSFDREVVYYDGFIGMYQKTVTSLKTGAVLRPTGPRKK